MTFWVAGAAVVGSIGGAAISSSAAGKAADTQAASTQAGIDEQRREYDTTRADFAPYREAGTGALGQYQRLMGIGSPGSLSGGGFDDAAYLAANPDVAEYIKSHPAGSVGYTTPQQHWELFGQKEGRSLGTPTQASADSEFGSYAKPLTQSEVQLDPGYQFGLTQGQQAIDRKTAAAGGRISGAALKAAAQYGTDYATTGYSTAYNRQNQARSDRLNRLAALAGIGQTATQQTSAAGQNSANQISGLVTAQGNATGASQVAQGNIWGNAGNQLAALYGRNSGGGGMSGAQAAFSQTGLGSSGFGTGLAYGNQDYGQFI